MVLPCAPETPPELVVARRGRPRQRHRQSSFIGLPKLLGYPPPAGATGVIKYSAALASVAASTMTQELGGVETTKHALYFIARTAVAQLIWQAERLYL